MNEVCDLSKNNQSGLKSRLLVLVPIYCYLSYNLHQTFHHESFWWGYIAFIIYFCGCILAWVKLTMAVNFYLNKINQPEEFLNIVFTRFVYTSIGAVAGWSFSDNPLTLINFVLFTVVHFGSIYVGLMIEDSPYDQS
jgi:tetrahydromethanopterin S-methyltransferase subunit E